MDIYMEDEEKIDFNFDVEDMNVFSREVEKRACLWDPTSKDFKDYFLKKKAWEEVCSILMSGFNDMPAKKRYYIGSDPMHTSDILIDELLPNTPVLAILVQKLARRWKDMKKYYLRRKRRFLKNKVSNIKASYVDNFKFLDQAYSNIPVKCKVNRAKKESTTNLDLSQAPGTCTNQFNKTNIEDESLSVLKPHVTNLKEFQILHFYESMLSTSKHPDVQIIASSQIQDRYDKAIEISNVTTLNNFQREQADVQTIALPQSQGRDHNTEEIPCTFRPQLTTWMDFQAEQSEFQTISLSHIEDRDPDLEQQQIRNQNGQQHPGDIDKHNRAFFESLIPYLRNFDSAATLEFRFEVLKLIKRVTQSQQSVFSCD